jgi:hypothetical protein
MNGLDRRGELAGHQHRRAAVGHGLHQIEDLEHFVVVADDVLEAEAQVELLLEGLVLEEQGLLADGLFDDDANFIIDNGFGQVIERAELDRLNRALDRAVAGDDDDDDVREATADGAEKLGGLQAGHVDVGQKQLDLRAFENGLSLFAAIGGADFVAFADEELRERLEHDPVFVHDQQSRLGLGIDLQHPIIPSEQGPWAAQCCLRATRVPLLHRQKSVLTQSNVREWRTVQTAWQVIGRAN